MAHNAPLAFTRREAIGLAIAAAASTRAWGQPPAALASPVAAGPTLTELRLHPSDFPDGLTSRVLRAPRRFDLAGLRYDGVVRPGSVRARRRGGAWSRWTVLGTGSDHAPDGAVRRAGEPAWFGERDELQVRLTGSGPLPRLVLVSSGRTLPLRAHAAQVAYDGGQVAPALVPIATVGGPAIVPRAAWGGDSVVPRAAPSYGTVQLAFVHHTVTANEYAPQDSAAMVLAIAKYHRDANGWNDIGYNFLVDRYGQVFEGRAGGIESAVVGAQAQGFNSVSTGVALLGTFTTEPAPPAALAALGDLVGWKLARHGVPVAGIVQVVSAGGPSDRYAKGVPVMFERVSGHRDGDRTDCPGNALYGQLAQIRDRAAQVAVGVAPVATTTPTPTGGAVIPITLTASADRVRARGRGVLVHGSAPRDQALRIAVSRQVRGEWRWIRTVPVPAHGADPYKVRVPLRRPGLYRIVAIADQVQSGPAVVRSIR